MYIIILKYFAYPFLDSCFFFRASLKFLSQGSCLCNKCWRKNLLSSRLAAVTAFRLAALPALGLAALPAFGLPALPAFGLPAVAPALGLLVVFFGRTSFLKFQKMAKLKTRNV